MAAHRGSSCASKLNLQKNQSYRDGMTKKIYFPENLKVDEGTLDCVLRKALFQMHSSAVKSHTLPLNLVMSKTERDLLLNQFTYSNCNAFRLKLFAASFQSNIVIPQSSQPFGSLLTFFSVFHGIFPSVIDMSVTLCSIASNVNVNNADIVPSFPHFVKKKVNQPSAPFCLLIPLDDDMFLQVPYKTVFRGKELEPSARLTLEKKAYLMRGDFPYSIHTDAHVLVVKFGTTEFSAVESDHAECVTRYSAVENALPCLIDQIEAFAEFPLPHEPTADWDINHVMSDMNVLPAVANNDQNCPQKEVFSANQYVDLVSSVEHFSTEHTMQMNECVNEGIRSVSECQLSHEQRANDDMYAFHLLRLCFLLGRHSH